jgi:hypothetical protein
MDADCSSEPIAYMAAKNHAERIRMSIGSNARLYVVDHMEMWARFYENFQFYERFMAITPGL